MRLILFLLMGCSVGIKQSKCICQEKYLPVCGGDGLTYQNSCKAICAQVNYIPGKCHKNCPCDPHHFRPVCGADGQTYKNKCYANCLNVVYQEGRCN